MEGQSAPRSRGPGHAPIKGPEGAPGRRLAERGRAKYTQTPTPGRIPGPAESGRESIRPARGRNFSGHVVFHGSESRKFSRFDSFLTSRYNDGRFDAVRWRRGRTRPFTCPPPRNGVHRDGFRQDNATRELKQATQPGSPTRACQRLCFSGDSAPRATFSSSKQPESQHLPNRTQRGTRNV